MEQKEFLEKVEAVCGEVFEKTPEGCSSLVLAKDPDHNIVSIHGDSRDLKFMIVALMYGDAMAADAVGRAVDFYREIQAAKVAKSQTKRKK